MTGGVPGKTLFPGDAEAQELYVAGYEDGYVRIWDASLPVLSLVLVLKGEVRLRVQAKSLADKIFIFRFFLSSIKIEIFSFDIQVLPIKVAGLSAPVSALDICHFTKSLAVGNEFGQVNAKFMLLYFSYSFIIYLSF